MLLSLSILPLVFFTNLTTSTKTPIPSLQPHNCTHPRPNTCTFYPLCLEPVYHCGPSGYPLSYGYKFCQKFKENRAALSPEGREWMVAVMLCLQEKLVPFVDGSKIATCDGLKEYAFSTHPTCYVECGFCSLSLRDWEVVVRIVGLETLFGSPESIRMVVETVEKCWGFYLWGVERGLF